MRLVTQDSLQVSTQQVAESAAAPEKKYMKLSEIIEKAPPETAYLILQNIDEQISLGFIQAVPLSGAEQKCNTLNDDGKNEIVTYRDLKILHTPQLRKWIIQKDKEARSELCMRTGVSEEVFRTDPESFDQLAQIYQRYQIKQHRAAEETTEHQP